MAKIPIQNVYYLLCYAWEQVHEGRIAEAGATGHTELADLFAQVLARGTRRVLRRGLDRGYVTRSEDTARLRGRIDFSASAKRALLPQAKARCTYDELSPNVLHNQILRTTLHELRQVENLDAGLSAKLRGLEQRFGDVDRIPLRSAAFSQVQLHAGNAFYRFLMNVCRLVHEHTIATEEGGRRFRDFRRDEATMWKLFEDFVFNFFKREQDVYRVGRPSIPWDLRPPLGAQREGESAEPPGRLPSMYTDIVLRSEARTIIIDTKFYKTTLQRNYGQPLYRSAHLYQLFGYLKNADAQGGHFQMAEGMLLYPTVSVELDDTFFLGGHRVQVATLDLAQDWRAIQEDLLLLAGINE